METTQQDYAWAAGLMSFAGSFVPVSGGGKGSGRIVRYVLRSVGKAQTLERLASIMGISTTITTSNGKGATMVTMQGDKLHHFLKQVWSQLPAERKKEYAEARKKAKDWKPSTAATKAARSEANKQRWADREDIELAEMAGIKL